MERQPARPSGIGSIFKLITLLAVFLVLLRIFPLVARFVEIAAISSVHFWWVLLFLGFIGLFYWTRKNKPKTPQRQTPP